MRRPELLGLAACVLLSGFWCIGAAQRLGVTFDEPTYVAAGLDRWRTGRIGGLMRLGTMPLPVDLTTAPIYVSERMQEAPFDLAADARAIPTRLADLPIVLSVARRSTLVFWLLLLVSGWLLARSLAGPWAGGLAAALLASDPNLLAHASLATTDIAAAGSLLAFLYVFHRGRGADWMRRVALPGLWFGVALLSKASALAFGPVGMLAIELTAVAGSDGDDWSGLRRRYGAALRRLGRDGLQLGAAGLAVVLVYCGSDGEVEPDLVEWTRGLSGWWAPAVQELALNLRIFSNGGEGLFRQIRHNLQQNGTFLLGQPFPGPVWYYFPVALGIKLPSAVVIGLAVSLAVVWHGRRAVPWPLAAAALLVACSPLFRLQTGIRLVLPLAALISVGVAVTLTAAVRGVGVGRRRAIAAVALAGLPVWNAVESLALWPDTLRYANVFWGGADATYRLLSDSNHDWGQGLPALAAWQRQQGEAPLDVWYFGTDPLAHDGPWRLVPLHAIPAEGTAAATAALSGRRLAAGSTLVYGAAFEPSEGDEPAEAGIKRNGRVFQSVLRNMEPAARVSTFLIYDIPPVSHPAD